MKYLNLGCGSRFHPCWDNLDFQSTATAVRAHDLRKGIPYPDAAFDVVYHSHVLEHFPKQDAPRFLRECYRVLKPGGVIRVAVPDLESIARLYLDALDKASQRIPGWADNYNWMLLELFDQTVRESSCGQLVDYFQQKPIPNWDFVRKRWGVQADILLQAFRGGANSTERASGPPKKAWGYLFRNPATELRNKLARILLGPDDWKALQVARFRNQGEIHMWMYDSYSLGRLLRVVGFSNPQRVTASESQIPDWSSFHLDTEPDGTVYKPDSLYLEGTKL
jgi:predicted SAM-dependent methyltransferase